MNTKRIFYILTLIMIIASSYLSMPWFKSSHYTSIISAINYKSQIFFFIVVALVIIFVSIKKYQGGLTLTGIIISFIVSFFYILSNIFIKLKIIPGENLFMDIIIGITVLFLIFPSFFLFIGLIIIIIGIFIE